VQWHSKGLLTKNRAAIIFPQRPVLNQAIFSNTTTLEDAKSNFGTAGKVLCYLRNFPCSLLSAAQTGCQVPPTFCTPMGKYHIDADQQAKTQLLAPPSLPTLEPEIAEAPLTSQHLCTGGRLVTRQRAKCRKAPSSADPTASRGKIYTILSKFWTITKAHFISTSKFLPEW